MADLMLESKANGTWEYEILEEKVKVKYPIKKGFQTIPGSHVATLEADHGYQTKVKRGIYVVLKGGKAIAASKADEKALEGAKDVKKAEELFKGKMAELKKEHAEQLKKDKEEFNNKIQSLTELKAEALNQVKALEKEKVELVGELSGLKESSEKKLKSLEDDKKSLEKKLAEKKAK